MGMPYSKEINSAFNQVTPLVAAGFEVLQTTKNIAILLAYIQVLTVVLLALILFALLGLLVTMNPDLEMERQMVVTPVVHWLAGWVVDGNTFGQAVAKWLFRFLVVVSIVGLGLFLGRSSAAGARVPNESDGAEGDEAQPDKES
jgi:hypothetical protein